MLRFSFTFTDYLHSALEGGPHPTKLPNTLSNIERLFYWLCHTHTHIAYASLECFACVCLCVCVDFLISCRHSNRQTTVHQYFPLANRRPIRSGQGQHPKVCNKVVNFYVKVSVCLRVCVCIWLGIHICTLSTFYCPPCHIFSINISHCTRILCSEESETFSSVRINKVCTQKLWERQQREKERARKRKTSSEHT